MYVLCFIRIVLLLAQPMPLFDHCPGHSSAGRGGTIVGHVWAETEQIVLGTLKSSSLSKAIKLHHCFVGVQSGLPEGLRARERERETDMEM